MAGGHARWRVDLLRLRAHRAPLRLAVRRAHRRDEVLALHVDRVRPLERVVVRRALERVARAQAAPLVEEDRRDALAVVERAHVGLFVVRARAEEG